MREFACVVGANCNSPMLQFVHIVNSSMLQIRSHYNSPMWMGELQFAHVAIRPHRKFIHVANSFTLQFTHVDGRIAIRPYCKIHPRCKIHPHFKFTHVERRIAIRPYTCIFWMLANIHVIKYKYTCKYLNTCKLMIERIYIPT